MAIFSAFKRTWRRRPATFAAGSAGFAVAAAIVGSAPSKSPVFWLLLFLLGTAGAAIALASVQAVGPRWVLGVCVALRILGLLGDPTLSDDIHRYVHEGRASRMGLAVPYAVPPADLVPPPDDGTTAKVNHPEVPAAYPPLSQLALWILIGVGDALGAPRLPLRLAFVALDLAVLALLFYWGRRRRSFAFARYGLHPLPVLEVAVGAHLDVLGVALLAAGALLALRPAVRGLLFGLACGVKPIAILGLLSLPLRLRAWAAAGGGLVLGVLLPTLPYLLAGAPLLAGLFEYSTRWEAAPTGYAAVEAVVGAPLRRAQAEGRWSHLFVDEGGLRVETAGRERLRVGELDDDPVPRALLLDHRLIARLAAGGLLLLVLGLLLRRKGPVGRLAWALAALWLLAPAVHPWYLLWVLPFAAVIGSRALWWWAASAPLAYQAAIAFAQTGVWEEALWPRVVSLGALFAGLVIDRREGRRLSARPGPPPAALP